MVTMLCDHVGSQFFSGNVNAVMRSIGRTAFPIYAFLIAEGFYHIKDRQDTSGSNKTGRTDASGQKTGKNCTSGGVSEKVRKHFNRLFLLCLISEIPYDLMETGKFFDWSGQSVMLTLLVGMAGLIIIEKFKDFPLFIFFVCAVSAVATYFTAPNYKLMGVLMIFFYYWFVTHCRDYSILKKYLILTAFSIVYLPLYNWVRYGFPGLDELVTRSLKGWSWLVPYLWINLLFATYNGKNGYKNKVLNTCYALFYPVHMLIIAIIEFAIGKFTL